VRTNSNDEHFQRLVHELDNDLWQRYPTTMQDYAPYNKLDDDVRVITAYDGDAPVGCGAFRPITDENIMEIKRMFVQPSARGRGIAKIILQALEKWGSELGFQRSRLETGNNQPEAVAVYQRTGYKRIPNYPPYTNMIDSICMAKTL
jgi:GNAT superfamily N-acetyltransferase